MRRRCGHMARRSSVVISVAPSRTVPPVGSTRRMAVLPTVDLPQPLSPTRPKVSPPLIAKETPSTARTTVRLRPKKPLLIGKCFRRSWTASAAAPSFFGAASSTNRLREAVGFETGDRMAAAERFERGALLAAALDDEGATVGKGAGTDVFGERRHETRDLLQPRAPPAFPARHPRSAARPPSARACRDGAGVRTGRRPALPRPCDRRT